MEFNVQNKAGNWERLRLADGVKLTFAASNNALAVGEYTLTRSVAFQAPYCVENDRIFGVSRVPWLSGERARRRLPARLTYGFGVLVGFVYVVDCLQDGYSLCFITLSEQGELCSRKDWSACFDWEGLGPSAEIVDGGVPPQMVASDTFATPYYGSGSRYKLPSFRLGDMLHRYSESVGGVVALPTQLQDVRVVLNAPKYPTNWPSRLDKPFVQEDVVDDDLRLLSWETTSWRYYDGIWSAGNETDYSEREVAYFYLGTYTKAKIKFPSDFPDDVFCVNVDEYGQIVSFIGGYSFDFSQKTTISADGNRLVFGEPLAGKEGEITDDMRIAFVRLTEYHNFSGLYHDLPWVLQGFADGDATPFDFRVQITITEEVSPIDPKPIFLRDNMPELSPLDYAKELAAVCGYFLSIGDNGVSFNLVPQTISDWRDLDVVAEVSSVKRTYSDWARHNEVGAEGEPAAVEYDIDNDTLDELKALYDLPVLVGEDSGDGVYINDLRVVLTGIEDGVEFDIEFLNDKPTFALYAPQRDELQPIPRRGNALITRLCANATRVVVRARMSAEDFFKTDATTGYLYGGQQYMWLSGTWSDGWADLVLQKY